MIWGSVFAGGFEEAERAIIDDEMIVKKGVSRAELGGKEIPKAATADFGSGAIEAEDRAIGMFESWLANGPLDLKPVPDGGDFAEGNTGLGHSERARVHPEEQDALGRIAVFAEVKFVSFPSIVERIINMSDRRAELEGVDGIAELRGRLNEMSNDFWQSKIPRILAFNIVESTFGYLKLETAVKAR